MDEKSYTPLAGQPKLNLSEFDAFTFRLKNIEERLDLQLKIIADVNRNMTRDIVDTITFYLKITFFAQGALILFLIMALR